jgi:hypothetical protein
MQTCAAMLREQGFTTLHIELDIKPPSQNSMLSSMEILGLYAQGSSTHFHSTPWTLPDGTDYQSPRISELNWQIRTCNIWPPVLVARSISTLIAQAYIESYSATGMALVGLQTLIPRPIYLPETLQKSHGSSMSSPENTPGLFIPPQFTYEPRFPILLVETEKYTIEKMEENDFTARESSLAREVGIELIREENGDGHEREMYERVSAWLQSIGV